MSDGAVWRRQRQLANPAFRTAALAAYLPVRCSSNHLLTIDAQIISTSDASFYVITFPIRQAIRDATETFLTDLDSGPAAPRDLYVDFNALTLRIVLQALFGASMHAAEAGTITCTC